MIDWSEKILLIDKPSGITSFDVIRRLRHVYSATHDGARAPKLGHAGTLDPLATGLMVIGVGPGTKQLAQLTKLDKTYEAVVCIGESRTTGDQEGEVVASQVVNELSRSDVHKALSELIGTHEYEVSAYSAIKQGGVPMYKRARQAAKQGRQLSPAELPRRAMTVYEAELLSLQLVEERAVATVRFAVASGTYIRSLAESLGSRLGYPACLLSLRRTQVGAYSLRDAIPLPPRAGD